MISCGEEGKRKRTFQVPFEAHGGISRIPPRKRWLPYDANSTDHVLFMPSRPIVNVLTKHKPVLEEEQEEKRRKRRKKKKKKKERNSRSG